MKEKILIVDDELHILQGYKRALRKHFKIHTASSGKQALEKVANDGPFAIVISDMRMPNMSGLELLSTLKETAPKSIRIMLTGNADQKTAVDAVNKGEVFKFLTKPCSPETLSETINSGLALYAQLQEKRAILEQSVNDIKILSDKLSYQSQHDYLTGLANRPAFELRLQYFLETALNEDQEHVLCHMDLDYFHVINDNCGHYAGDECLRQIGDLLSSQQRGNDALARLTSDKFGILLNNCTLDEAGRIISGLHERLKQYTFEWERKSFDISASIGLIPINNKSTSVASLLSTAETACCVAMDHGGNQLHIGKEDDRELTQRLNESQWVSKIHTALKENRFRLFFQTIAPINGNQESGEHYEILLRMVDENKQYLSPLIFMQAAENYYLSPLIDKWVIKNVCSWFMSHPEQLDHLSVCSINLSGHSIGNRDILDYICNTFEGNSLPLEKFCFEVTETAAIAQLGKAISFIDTLKSRGFFFSLDDFGTGFSSFAYLKNLPVDYLKIDGEFVKNIHINPVDNAMVRSINEIGKLMGKTTIAEYVENNEIMASLKTLNVDFAQGYLLNQPQPLDDKL
ncbi:MAG: EAL domain-containing protein [gamma proteobacterium symbiont of Bathyaustriella thionipta]|nr:EAL domain-containing protein [gamma proteobacterium symbiont of Bathyaustriella thionipta]MCU7948794.1 EAL domain-containing protein [gamma proteobacterium symbiont of Bathyaustriella thionipta]MCU7954206.1 EAL domain-containing protein [gamma proteobacterium symbiont of Bathyaustriella thionipta]MCU7955252.1 EAL domain-containing protein [gamma proteobacterium symbiont of Bathyaustriella thionipta]MCU7966261.1 EAL domain-containing protein [gamma proteobacterium symbiont of Bathyaustriella